MKPDDEPECRMTLIVRWPRSRGRCLPPLSWPPHRGRGSPYCERINAEQELQAWLPKNNFLIEVKGPQFFRYLTY